MNKRRIIPCLDIRDGKVVKGINFLGVKEVGEPLQLAKLYETQGADELCLLDISATDEGRTASKQLISDIRNAVKIPFTVGGGIATLSDIERALTLGASKVSIGTAGVKNPDFLAQATEFFGGDKIVAAVDGKKVANGWNVFVNGGKKDTGIRLVNWVKQVESLGVGEILLTSMEADGMKTGFDIPMLNEVCNAVRIPVIASGGCGKLVDFSHVFKQTNATAALAASMFHYGEVTVEEVKNHLKSEGLI